MNLCAILFGMVILITSINFVYASQGNYLLEIDEHSYNLAYSFEGDVIAMAIDQELNSLLIGIENTRDSPFEITLPNEMINAENNEFAVLVNGVDTDYQLFTDNSGLKIQFFVPTNTEEIEIVGTHVIPEFPLGIFSILGIFFVLLIIMTKNTKINFFNKNF